VRRPRVGRECGVAVADDLQVDVISCSPAGEHGVQLLPGFLPGQQAVHGVGGDALGGMDGIAETGRGAHIVDGQPDGQLAAVVPDREITAPADAGDGPPVAVLDPVGRSESESAVVAAGDDHISDARLIAVRQPHHRMRLIPVEAVVSGATVEFGDKLAGGGEHDRVELRRPIEDPSGERIRSHGCHVADMNTIVIEIEGERGRLAFAEGE
jgi:hypothetical protein